MLVPVKSFKHFFKQLNRLFKQGITHKKRKCYPFLLYCTGVKKWVIQIMNQRDLNWNNGSNLLYLWNFSDSSLKLEQKGLGDYSYVEIMNNMGYSKEEYIKT